MNRKQASELVRIFLTQGSVPGEHAPFTQDDAARLMSIAYHHGWEDAERRTRGEPIQRSA